MKTFSHGLFILTILLAPLGSAKPLTLVAATGYEKVAAYKEIIAFTVDVLKDAGLDIKVVEVPRMRGALTVENGEYDALPIRGLEDAKSLPNVLITSFPIAFTNFRIVSMKTNKVFSEKDLKKFTGAVVLNNSSLQKEIGKRQLQVNEVNVGYPELVNMLVLKRVDYIVAPEELIASIQDSDKSLKTKLRIGSNVFVRIPLYFSINRKHRALLPDIEKIYRKILTGDTSRYKYIHDSLNHKLEQP